MESIFITGASGCVGHYVIDYLKKNYSLYILVRSPHKLHFDPAKYDNITLIHDDLDNIKQYRDILAQVEYCIHIATVWGGENTEKINVHRTHEMFDLLNENKLKRIIYFSTASILNNDMKLLPEAEQYGTDYIRTKSLCYQKLSSSKHQEKIITVFPTLVFGGDKNHRLSSLSKALPRFKKYSWLLGRINVDISFHFIHADDIAKIVSYLLTVPEPESNYVIGNKPITFGEFTKKAAAFFGHKIGWQLTISPEKIYRFIKLIGVEVSKWDYFCMKHKNFTYPVINCSSLKIPSQYNTLEDILADWKKINRKIK